MSGKHLDQVEVQLWPLVATIMNQCEFMYGEEFLG